MFCVKHPHKPTKRSGLGRKQILGFFKDVAQELGECDGVESYDHSSADGTARGAPETD